MSKGPNPAQDTILREQGPLSLTPRFSGVGEYRVRTSTASAVYLPWPPTGLPRETAKAVVNPCVQLATPLKQGVNENKPTASALQAWLLALPTIGFSQ